MAVVEVTSATTERAKNDQSRWLRNSKLSLVCFAVFGILIVAQSLTGWTTYNHDNRAHDEPSIGYPEYLTTGHFYETTFENWESEFLQMAAYIALTVFLVQKGSAESKKPEGEAVDDDPEFHRDDPDAPWPVRRGGAWLVLYKNSLLIVFFVLFLLSMLGHALGGTAEYNAEQKAHHQGSPASVVEFVGTSEFWYQSFQNWQSEFLAVGSIVVLSIFLRQKGSPESKPVHAPHSQTGSE